MSWRRRRGGGDKKRKKTSTRHAFTYQLFGWPQVTTRFGFIEKKKLQRQISPLRIHQMVSELLAWPVWLERTYSLNAVLVTGAGPWRLTIYAPGRPQTPTPSRTSVVLWLFGRRAEPSHNPNGTSFKTRLFPALHVPSLETLGHMPADVITVLQLSGTAYRCGFLPSASPQRFFSCFAPCCALFCSVSRLPLSLLGLGSDAPMSQEDSSRGAACSTALAPFSICVCVGGTVVSLPLICLHSFIPLPPLCLSLWLRPSAPAAGCRSYSSLPLSGESWAW